MAEELLHNIYRLDVPLPHNPLKNLNSYFLRGQKGGRSLLIDTGFRQEACRSAMLEELAAVGADQCIRAARNQGYSLEPEDGARS